MAMQRASTASRERLWLPVVAPVVWSTHFTLCYTTAALACGRFADVLPPARVRGLLAAFTVAAVAGMLWCVWDGWRRLGKGWPRGPHDDDTPHDRRRFMAFTTVLLAGLSVLATVFEAAALWAVDRCT